LNPTLTADGYDSYETNSPIYEGEATYGNFMFEERASDSPLIEKIWRTQSDYSGTFISQAEIRSEIVVMKHNGKTSVTVRGPETKATTISFPFAGAEIFAIVFKPGSFMPYLPPQNLRDHNSVELPDASSKSFWLYGSAWEFPNYDNADTFVRRLVHEGLLVHDPTVDAVRHGYPQAMSIRALQYHFLQATGMTHQTVRQIERAHLAAIRLAQGVSILDVVAEAGYFDQPHLTRSLKRFLGQTPNQIIRASRPD
jgi:AraC-like DNA-binding protein